MNKEDKQRIMANKFFALFRVFGVRERYVGENIMLLKELQTMLRKF
jgi:hypothetical protein